MAAFEFMQINSFILANHNLINTCTTMHVFTSVQVDMPKCRWYRYPHLHLVQVFFKEYFDPCHMYYSLHTPIGHSPIGHMCYSLLSEINRSFFPPSGDGIHLQLMLRVWGPRLQKEIFEQMIKQVCTSVREKH